MSVSKTSSLRHEIIAILAIKLVLIVALKLVFFSDPLRPGEAGTARALLTSPSVATSVSTAAHPTESSHE